MLKEYDIDKLNPRRTSYAKELQQQKSIKYCLECCDMSDWDKLREKLNMSEEEEMIIDAEKDKLRIILVNKGVIKNDVGRVQNRSKG